MVDQWWPEEQGGNAEITTGVVIVQADQANYHWDNGAIDARGNVHVIPIPCRPSPGVGRFGIKQSLSVR
jgi:hypothetical protein